MTRNRYIEGYKAGSISHLKAEALRIEEQFETDVYKDKEYVIRWKSNNAVPPQDVLDFWKYIGKRFNMQKAKAARTRETKEFIERYKKSNKTRKHTQEELFEMRAAFGEGVIVKNIITGRETRT